MTFLAQADLTFKKTSIISYKKKQRNVCWSMCVGGAGGTPWLFNCLTQQFNNAIKDSSFFQLFYLSQFTVSPLG